MAEVDPDQRHAGRAGQLSGAQQAAVAAHDEYELDALRRVGAGRHLLGTRGAELARQGADGNAGAVSRSATSRALRSAFPAQCAP